VAALVAISPAGAQTAPDKVSFGTNWVAEGRARRIFPGSGDGTYKKYWLDVTIVPGGPNDNNRMLLIAGKLDFFMAANTLMSFDAAANNVPVVTVAAIFQKDPQVFLTHPESKVAKLEDLKPLTLFVSKEGITSYFQWLKSEYGFSEEKVKPYYVQLTAVSRRPPERDAGLCHLGAVRDRGGTRCAGEAGRKKSHDARPDHGGGSHLACWGWAAGFGWDGASSRRQGRFPRWPRKSCAAIYRSAYRFVMPTMKSTPWRARSTPCSIRSSKLTLGMRTVLDSAAHDLRTPLNRLQATAEGAMSSLVPGSAERRVLERVTTEVDQMRSTLDALLRIALAETGTVAREPVDLSELVASVVELYAPVSEERGIVLESSVALGAQVLGNRQLLAQALANLLDNAIKFTPDGGHIRVVLDGSGIAPQSLWKITDRVFRRISASSCSAAVCGWMRRGNFRIRFRPVAGSGGDEVTRRASGAR